MDDKKKPLYHVTGKCVDRNTTRKHSTLKWKCKISLSEYCNETECQWSTLPGNKNSRKRKLVELLQFPSPIQESPDPLANPSSLLGRQTPRAEEMVPWSRGTCHIFGPRARFTKQLQIIYFLSRFFCWNVLTVTSCQSQHWQFSL